MPEHDIETHELISEAHASFVYALRWCAEARDDHDYGAGVAHKEHMAAVLREVIRGATITCAGCKHDQIVKRELRNIQVGG